MIFKKAKKLHLSGLHDITIKIKDDDIDRDARDYAKAIISNNKNDVLTSKSIRINDIFFPNENPQDKKVEQKSTINKYFTTRKNFQLDKDVKDYYIEVLFTEGGSKKILEEKKENLPLYFKNKNNLTFESTYSAKEIEKYKDNLGEFVELHKITGNLIFI